jgi:hypothetical protein
MLPRTAATAFGVRISMDSPGRMRCLATASTTLPLGSVTTARPGSSLIVTSESSRTVRMALPPSSTRISEFSWVLMRSRPNTSSLNLSASGTVSAGRATVARPSRVVTTPTASDVCASAGPGRGAVATSAASTAIAVHRVIVFCLRDRCECASAATECLIIRARLRPRKDKRVLNSASRNALPSLGRSVAVQAPGTRTSCARRPAPRAGGIIGVPCSTSGCRSWSSSS